LYDVYQRRRVTTIWARRLNVRRTVFIAVFLALALGFDMSVDGAGSDDVPGWHHNSRGDSLSSNGARNLEQLASDRHRII
jgi:hypothetical protein